MPAEANILPSVAAGEILTLDRPEQLKALGHPLRLRVLEVLGESMERLTNRELAARLGVDPGHLHFHVRMLLNAGLIELAEGGRRREKPYRAVAPHIRVAPELLTAGAANDARAAMLEMVQRGYASFAAEGNFRSTQITVRLDFDQVRDVVRMLIGELEKLENPSREPLVITVFSHPNPTGDGGPVSEEAEQS
jgi:DNA-binding transcriptional ArsR family regulator